LLKGTVYRVDLAGSGIILYGTGIQEKMRLGDF
jgi:hypothetical protein